MGEDKKGDGRHLHSGEPKMGESDFVAYFDQAGEINTNRTIELVAQRCKDLSIKHVVVATSTGETAIKVAAGLKDQDVKIIAVTLHAGLWEKYVSPDPDKMKAAEEMGVTFLTCTHALMGNVGNAIMEKFGGISMTDLIAHTYYTFSQGTKVAVEIAVAAADAGLIPVDQEVISIAGSDTGADTALMLRPAYSTDFFSLRVRELIAKPR
ncbi:pyruvate kinase alpha/beta domain-containing protein [Candidatus Poribacteria bacterium]